MKILVFSDKLNALHNLCGAKSLGAQVDAFAVCSEDEAKTIPASQVFFAKANENIMFEDYLSTLKEVVNSVKPDVIITNSTKRCKLMAGRLAAFLNTSVLTDLSNIEIDGNTVKGSQMFYGGLALRTLKGKGCTIVTVSDGIFEAEGGNAESVNELPAPSIDSKIKRISVNKKEGSKINIAVAKKIVSVGRGFAAKDDLKLATDLADAIGAEMACSRPIAEGEGWMETSRYVGVTGVILKPDLYIAIGISGQVQHLVGITSSKTIIAVNKDKNAPIFKNCDYGIVGDLYKILPALNELVQK